MAIAMERVSPVILVLEILLWFAAFAVVLFLSGGKLRDFALFFGTILIIELILYIFTGRTFLGTKRSWDNMIEKGRGLK